MGPGSCDEQNQILCDETPRRICAWRDDRLVVTVCVLLLVWHLRWLQGSGIGRSGSRQAWLIAVAGLIYFAGASLYSLYGKAGFDFSSLIRLPAAPTTVLTQFTVGLSEEILFRGLILYGLVRVWGTHGAG